MTARTDNRHCPFVFGGRWMMHFPDRSRFHLAAWLVAACSSLAPAHALVTPTLSTRVDHGVVVREDGTLWTWGSNTGGQIGDGTFDTRWIPWQVGTSTDWKIAAAGTNSTHAIRGD